jgi:hypothetical protein
VEADGKEKREKNSVRQLHGDNLRKTDFKEEEKEVKKYI